MLEGDFPEAQNCNHDPGPLVSLLDPTPELQGAAVGAAQDQEPCGTVGVQSGEPESRGCLADLRQALKLQQETRGPDDRHIMIPARLSGGCLVFACFLIPCSMKCT